MITMSIEVRNLDKLQDNFKRAPSRALYWLARATKAAIFEVEKQAIDPNFRFKTPRALRTGQLQLSFKHGRNFFNGGLRGSIGPTVHYAPYVYFGTRKVRPNSYMDRIATAATPDVEKHFETAIDTFTAELATT